MLTVTQAQAVNTLVGWVLHRDRPDEHGTVRTAEDARKAAAMLARNARKALLAGLTPADVERLWPAQTFVPRLPVAMKRPTKAKKGGGS